LTACNPFIGVVVGAGVSVGDNVIVGIAVLLIAFVIAGIAVEAEVAIGLQAVSAVTTKIAVPVANLYSSDKPRIVDFLLCFGSNSRCSVIRPNGLA